MKTELETNYGKSCDFWIEAQENLIESIKINIDNSEAMIKIHKKILKNGLESLDHEVKVLNLYKESIS